MIPLLAAFKGDTTKKAALLIGGVALVGVGYFVISRKLKKKQIVQNYQKYEKQIGVNTPDGKAAGYASLLYSAMDGMGTNEDVIYDTLRKMRSSGVNFASVANAYRNLYADDLLKRIQKELNAKEYVEFQELV